jgi:mRNA interferase RelE/StbE
MQPAKAAQIETAVDSFAADPQASGNNVRALKGLPGAYRIRVGDWRVSMKIAEDGKSMVVFEIAPRGAAYRKKG